MKNCFCVIVFSSFVFCLNSQTLSKTELKIGAEVDAGMPSTMQLLRNSVNINSGTLNLAGVKAVGDMFAKELAAIGFAIDWIKLPDSLKRSGHLVATHKGTKGKKLLLVGHLDTVFEPDMPANPFTQLSDSTATGQGIVDMKGGDVMIMAALKALHKQGLLNDVSITVYFTGDEEKPGNPLSVTRSDFIEKAKQHDVALCFETSLNLNLVSIARRGNSDWLLEVEARQGHSGGVFGAGGYGAIYEASRIINEFREKLSHEQYLTFNPGLFIGGSEIDYMAEAQSGKVSGKTNIISPKAVVKGDLRFVSRQQLEKAKDDMRQIVSKNLPGATARISFEDIYPAMSPKPGSETLVKKLNDLNIALGYGEAKAADPSLRGAGDLSFIAEYLDCLDGLGANGRGTHAPGEVINLSLYPKLIKRTALLIYRLTR
jgi:glutamate carboxypeptidase